MHPGQNGSQDWVSRPVLRHSYLGGALSLAQESPECDVRNGWVNNHHLMSQVPVQIPGQTGNQECLCLFPDASSLFNNLLQQYCLIKSHEPQQPRNLMRCLTHLSFQACLKNQLTSPSPTHIQNRAVHFFLLLGS